MTPFNLLTAPLTPGTRVLIEANAGTGKTFNIQNLYLRLILEHALEPSRILVVTFTEAATAELRDRIRQNLAAALAEIGDPQSETSNPQPPAASRPSLIAGLLAQAAARRSPDDLRASLRLALAAFDEAAIFTIHGFCKRTTDRNAFDSRVLFDCELSPSTDTLLRESVTDFFRRERLAPDAPGIPLSDLLSHARLVMGHAGDVAVETAGAAGPAIDAYARLRAFLHDPAHGFAARMRRQQTMSYDDLLRNMRAALAGGPECPLARDLRATYAAAMIDEFQDTDPVQYEIFQTVFAHADSALFMIGDPKQAIYGFRGGDIYTYLQAKAAVAESSRFSLSQNFRSSRELIEAVNRLFSPPGVFTEADLGYEPSGCGREPPRRLLLGEPPAESPRPFEVLWFTGGADGQPVASSNLEPLLTRACAARIADLLVPGRAAFQKDGQAPVPVSPGDIAVLTTSNRQAEDLQKRLRLHNIPAVIYKAGNIYASEDADNLWHLLCAMAEPHRPGKVKAALLTPHCGLAPDDLLAFEAAPRAHAFESHTRAFADLGRLWQEKGILPALSALLAHFNSLERLARHPACERRLTNLRHLTERLHQTERAADLRPDALLSAFKRQLADPDPDDETHEQRMESDRRAVTLTTIHKSKGLQFPIVFVPYLLTHDIRKSLRKDWTVHAPDARGDMRPVLPVGDAAKEQLLPQRLAENLAEHLRLLYVAVTRAENRCVLLMGTRVSYGRDPIQSAVAHLSRLAAPALDGAAPFTVEPVSADGLDRQNAEPRYMPPDTRDELAPPPEPPAPADDWAVLSYSGMTLHEFPAPSHLKPDAGTDEVDAALPLPSPSHSPRERENDLPGGKTTGLCLHAIFEGLDFTHVTPDWRPAPEDADLIDRQAAAFGLYTPASPSAAARRARIAALLSATLTRPLAPETDTLKTSPHGYPAPEGTHPIDLLKPKNQKPKTSPFTLASIPLSDTRREWEFFFKVPRRIPLDAFRQLGLTFRPDSGARHGFMTGSIDLLFRRDGRYGFADWKTDMLPDYSPAALTAAMTERNYLFQAIIYAVALHAHLKQSLGRAYDYDRHFGGGHYFFVRGINAECGLFPFRPSLAELEHWSHLLAR
jgi:exodeoxyribonuclease V beta subunit